jgi:hypothetical protein
MIDNRKLVFETFFERKQDYLFPTKQVCSTTVYISHCINQRLFCFSLSVCLNSQSGESTSEVLKVAIQARSRALGPFHPTFDVNKIIRDALEKVLPEDCHKRVNGRLHISVTRVSDSKNVILSQFDSKEDLIQVTRPSVFHSNINNKFYLNYFYRPSSVPALFLSGLESFLPSFTGYLILTVDCRTTFSF